MSQKYLWGIWCEELRRTKKLANEDEAMMKMQPFKSKTIAMDVVSDLYIRYLLTTNRLSEVADHMRDPVTLPLVRKVYELLLTRTLQLKIELSRLLCQNHINFDDKLIQAKLTTADISYKIPSYLLDSRRNQMEKRNEFITEVLNKIEMENRVSGEVEEAPSKRMDDSDWVYRETINPERKTIMVERKTIFSEAERNVSQMTDITDTIQHELSTSSSEEITIVEKASPFEKEQEWNEKNRRKQKELEEHLNEKLIHWANMVTREYKEQKEEDVEDEMRGWIDEFFRLTGHYPPYPPNEQFYVKEDAIYGNTKKLPVEQMEKDCNIKVLPVPKSTFSWDYVGVEKLEGSSLITGGYWLDAKQELEKAQETASDKNKKRKGTAKPAKKPAKAKAKEAPAFKLNETEHCEMIKELLKNRKECGDQGISHWDEDIQSSALANLEKEVRLMVDETMRREMQLIEEAVSMDKGTKKKKKGKKKGKKSKRGKRKGKKDKKDLTASKTSEECMEELVRSGVLKIPKAARFQDYIAEKYWTERSEMSAYDVVQLITERFVLPLSSATVHHFVPRTSSLCIVGPERSGRSYLADCLATASGATVFDISPTVTTGIYPGKKGIQMLIALVKRLSRELQPSVILVKDIDKVFYKKVPKQERAMNPKRMAGVLKKLVKGITENDRVVLVGTAGTPWLAQGKKLMKVCEQFVNLPSTHYGQHSQIWQRWLTECNPSLEPAALAKLSSSVGCSYFQIMETYLKAQGEEIGQGLGQQIVRVFMDLMFSDKSKYAKFMARTPLARAREAMLTEEEAAKNSKKKRR